MKNSGAPDIGDIVQHKQDLTNSIECIGTIIEIRGIECLVMWSSDSLPACWHDRDKLVVINEG
mgnify:CR=1 FL=1|jgi:hypothetical protein